MKMLEIDDKQLAEYDGITGARLWDKVPGKERIYMDTEKFNGGRRWNGGVGYTRCFVDLNAHELIAQGEAGATTRQTLRPTLEQIAADYGLSLTIRKM